jgi:hypothetical protein
LCFLLCLPYNDTGDFAEVPETCPFTTTCPDICVEDEIECPTACANNLTLCADGTCNTFCDDVLESPCACGSLNVTCAKVIDYYDSCQLNFGALYNATAVCIAEEEAEKITKLSFTGPFFLLCYYWISGVTFAVIAFCFVNQKLIPVHEAVQTLTPISNAHEEWKQIGYKKNIIGNFICLLVWTTLWGIQALLLILTLFYYIQQDAVRVAHIQPVFEDEVQVLKAFEYVL